MSINDSPEGSGDFSSTDVDALFAGLTSGVENEFKLDQSIISECLGLVARLQQRVDVLHLIPDDVERARALSDIEEEANCAWQPWNGKKLKASGLGYETNLVVGTDQNGGKHRAFGGEPFSVSHENGIFRDAVGVSYGFKIEEVPDSDEGNPQYTLNHLLRLPEEIDLSLRYTGERYSRGWLHSPVSTLEVESLELQDVANDELLRTKYPVLMAAIESAITGGTTLSERLRLLYAIDKTDIIEMPAEHRKELVWHLGSRALFVAGISYGFSDVRLLEAPVELGTERLSEPCDVVAKEVKNFTVWTGKVVDKATGKPVETAHIGLNIIMHEGPSMFGHGVIELTDDMAVRSVFNEQ